MKTVGTFPETVDYKSCTATIYCHKHREGERYEVRYYDLDTRFAPKAGSILRPPPATIPKRVERSPHSVRLFVLWQRRSL